MIREALASLARQESVSGLISRTPLARDLVERVVGGEDLHDVMPVASDLADRGFHLALEHMVPSVEGRAQVSAAIDDYAAVVDAVADAGLASVSEVIVFAEALGQHVPGSDPRGALAELARSASARGVGLQLGTGELADLPEALAWARDLVDSGTAVGVTLPAIWRATEREVVAWADGRVRLVKGAHGGGGEVHRQPLETDKAFVRCARTLLRGAGHPSFATHDPRLIAIVQDRAAAYGRAPQTFEFAFYLGRQTGEQDRLLAAGHSVRVYVPFGHRWLERLVGGLAEQPTGIASAVRSLLPV